MKTGVYFGSFNPPHKGHIRIARSMIRKKLVDKLIIVPTGNYWDKQDLMPIQNRIEMLEHFKEDDIIIDKEHNHLVKTYELMRALSEQRPDDQLYLIVGADNLVRFDEWVNYKELLSYPFIIVRRDDIDKRDIIRYMKGFSKENYTVVDMPKIDISSTYIREHIDDYSKIRNMIYRDTYDYILKHSLIDRL